MEQSSGAGLICNKCGWENRPGAKFCAQCRNPLVEPDQRSSIEHMVDDLADGITSIFQKVSSRLTSHASPEPPPAPVSPAAAIASSSPTRPIAGTFGPSRQAPPARAVRPLNRGEKIGYFYLTETIPVQGYAQLMYYYARWIICPYCNNPVANILIPTCASCKRPLPDLLIRQSGATIPPQDKGLIQRLLEMSAQEALPGVLPHERWFVNEEMVYTVLSRPVASWQPLPAMPTRQPPEVVVNWFRKVVEAIDLLHSYGYALFDERRPDLRDPFIITGDQTAFFVDLTSCRSVAAYPEPASEIKRDFRILARLLYLLISGQNMTARLSGVSLEMRKVFDKSRHDQFTSARELLDALERVPQPPPLARGLRQAVGYATDIGVARQANEDFVGQYSFALEQTPGGEQIGLYIVADGMGGHAAGERASQDVVRVIVEKIHEQKLAPDLRRATRLLDQSVSNQEVLAQAISRANDVLVEARKTGGSDRGTTLTTAFIVGSTATVANIGDSRTYLYRAGALEQVTRDHSLVASLVAAGQLSKEDARQHPNRNQVYRTLGDKARVDPDFFPINLAPDDMLLLCSDGLWEMINDQAIEDILKRAASPQKACDELIRAANAAGGEDNISAIVVKIE